MHKYYGNLKTIYLSGGCFWNIEAYFKELPGVINTDVGYANGHTENPTYEEVCTGTTGHAEVAMIEYNPDIISSHNLLLHFSEMFIPPLLNTQNNDTSAKSRMGIYYENEKDRTIIEEFLAYQTKNYKGTISVEVDRIRNFYKAEAYHQEYLDKNPRE